MKNTNEIKFEWKDGHLLANNKNVAYILPSDQTEVCRLKLNHELWKSVIGGLYKSPIHDQLVKGIRVLDVGCGPGWWTLDMARLYPNSEFIGIDMADVFVTENAPPNVTFKILNAGTNLDYFEDETFDFVFQRFLVMGFPKEQYIKSIQEIKRILKPNGHIEIMELVNEFRNAGPAFKRIETWIDQALVARNMDSFIADKISGYLLNVGYKDVKDVNYEVPIGSWGGETGEMFLSIQHLALPAVKVMVNQLTCITSEEYDMNLEEAFNEVDCYNLSTRFRLIYASKI